MFFVSYYLQKKSKDEVDSFRQELSYSTSIYDRDLGIDYLQHHETLLHVLCRKGYAKVVKLWCEEVMVDLYRNERVVASIRNPRFNAMQLSEMSAKADPSKVTILTLVNDFNENPLQLSVTWGHNEVTKTLKVYCPSIIFKSIERIRYCMHLMLLNRKLFKTKVEEFRKRQMVEEANGKSKGVIAYDSDNEEAYINQRNKFLYGSDYDESFNKSYEEGNSFN